MEIIYFIYDYTKGERKMKYSPVKEIEEKLCQIEQFLVKDGILLKKVKDISYGVQIIAQGQNEDGKITVYYSDKKGFSAVENIKNDTSQKVVSCIENLPISQTENKRFVPHFGSDEAGKGDFFGPLVVACFFADCAETENDLKNLGVCDSKKLTDKKIDDIAKILYSKYGEKIAVVCPSVEKYNEMYSGFKNLNLMLGWMHAKAIEKLHAKFPFVRSAIFDKFADETLVTRFLQNPERLNVDAVVHGEDNDIAVAAASVIARSYFVKKMKELSSEHKTHIPLGAGNNVIAAGKVFVREHGWGNLKFAVKLHFKTIEKLR